MTTFFFRPNAAPPSKLAIYVSNGNIYYLAAFSNPINAYEAAQATSYLRPALSSFFAGIPHLHLFWYCFRTTQLYNAYSAAQFAFWEWRTNHCYSCGTLLFGFHKLPD